MSGFEWLRRAVGPAAVVALVAAAGCGEKNGRLPVHPAKGQVTVGGKPAEGVIVTFTPTAARAADVHAYVPSGQTDTAGNFTLSTYETGDGAPEGEYTVTAQWPVRFNVISNQWEGDKLKGKYRDTKASRLTATIKPGPNEIPPIALD